MATKKVQTSFRIDQHLLSAFQHKLVDRKTSMTAVLEELIRGWVDGPDHPADANIVHLEPEPRGVSDELPFEPLDVLRSIPIVVVIKDCHSRVLWCNDAYEQLTGRVLPDLQGLTAREIWGASRGGDLYADAILDHERQVVAERKSLNTIEQIPTSRGLRERESYRFPILGATGRLVGIGVIARDYTSGGIDTEMVYPRDSASLPMAELRCPQGLARAIHDEAKKEQVPVYALLERALGILSASRTLPDRDAVVETDVNSISLRAFLHALPVVVTVKDLAGRIVYVNTEYEKMTGKPLNAVAGRLPSDHWPPEVAAKIAAHDKYVRQKQTPILTIERIPAHDRIRERLTFRFPVYRDGQLVMTGSLGFDFRSIWMKASQLFETLDETNFMKGGEGVSDDQFLRELRISPEPFEDKERQHHRQQTNRSRGKRRPEP